MLKGIRGEIHIPRTFPNGLLKNGLGSKERSTVFPRVLSVVKYGFWWCLQTYSVLIAYVDVYRPMSHHTTLVFRRGGTMCWDYNGLVGLTIEGVVGLSEGLFTPP